MKLSNGFYYIFLILTPIFFASSYNVSGDEEFGFLLLGIISACFAWKLAEDDAYIKLIVKNISKKFRTHKENLKKNLDD